MQGRRAIEALEAPTPTGQYTATVVYKTELISFSPAGFEPQTPGSPA